MDEDYVNWNRIIVILVIVGIGLILAAGHFAGFKVSGPQENIHWMEQPLMTERNPQGQVIGGIILGYDEKGYVRWGRAPLSPAVPAAAPVPAPQPAAAKKPEEKHGK